MFDKLTTSPTSSLFAFRLPQFRQFRQFRDPLSHQHLCSFYCFLDSLAVCYSSEHRSVSDCDRVLFSHHPTSIRLFINCHTPVCRFGRTIGSAAAIHHPCIHCFVIARETSRAQPLDRVLRRLVSDTPSSFETNTRARLCLSRASQFSVAHCPCQTLSIAKISSLQSEFYYCCFRHLRLFDVLRMSLPPDVLRRNRICKGSGQRRSSSSFDPRLVVGSWAGLACVHCSLYHPVVLCLLPHHPLLFLVIHTRPWSFLLRVSIVSTPFITCLPLLRATTAFRHVVMLLCIRTVTPAFPPPSLHAATPSSYLIALPYYAFVL